MTSRFAVFVFSLFALAICIVEGVESQTGDNTRRNEQIGSVTGFQSNSGNDRTPLEGISPSRPIQEPTGLGQEPIRGTDNYSPNRPEEQNFSNTRPSSSGHQTQSGSHGGHSGSNNYDRENVQGPSGIPERNQEGSSFSSQEPNRHTGSHSSNQGFSNSQGSTRPPNSEYQNRPSQLEPNREGDRFPTDGLTSGLNQHENVQTGRPDHHEGHSQNRPIGEDITNNNKENTEHGNKDGEKKPNEEEEEEEKEVCFSYLGCFDMGKPWRSTLRPVKAPQPPEKIATTIFFYSRDNIDKQKNITLYPQINMGGAQFNPRKLSAIIVHGFSNSGNATWMKEMKNAYLKQVDANIMIVDWGKGAQLLSYLQVAGNTRVVGKQLAMFVNFLIQEYGADPGKFHLIGHSLGAQICSYLAKDVPGIARLTALDPAQPGFEGFDKEVRLHSSDAEFVDVVHTDARPFLPTLGFGMIAPVGHVDFYMNGGFDQPGCVPLPKKDLPKITNILDLGKFPVEVIGKMVACPHARAYEYLTEAFNETEKCIFWGHKADVSNVIKSVTNTVTQGVFKKFVALSTTCSKEDCIPLGFATKKSPLRGSFVVTTSGRQPYCISEPGIPAEVPPEQPKRQSVIQKIAKG